MAAKKLVIYAILGLMGLMFSCGTEESGVYSVSVTYKQDCDRRLRQADQPGHWELAHMNCIFYDNGKTDKPTFRPITRDKMYLIASLEQHDIRECQVSVSGEIVQAQCQGFSQPIALGYTTVSGNILLNPNLSLDIYLQGNGSLTYFDSSAYTIDSAQAYGIIAIRSKDK